MKPGKTLLIVAFIVIVLIVIAYLVSQSNKKKTASALSNQPPANANITGRYVALSSLLSPDYSEIVNGKSKWLWSGNGNCLLGYTKILTGLSAGWCILNTSLSDYASKTGYTCIQKDNAGGCIKWKDSSGNVLVS